MSTTTMHHKCRNNVYPDFMKRVERQYVPDDKVLWLVKWPEYNPPTYTSERIKGQVWADPDIVEDEFKPRWHQQDGNINRVSHVSKYNVVDGYPINPVGRTGLRGRGILGKWGPNHAADPVITRWKKDLKTNDPLIHPVSKKPVLQFVAVKRRDSKEWALPGGMVDAGETVSTALQREFMEEAMNFLEKSPNEKKQLQEKMQKMFKEGLIIYQGYVDDPRNTDNAWMETVVINHHDDSGNTFGSLSLNPGDDATGVQWMDVDCNLRLYASHATFFKHVVDKLNAHW